MTTTRPTLISLRQQAASFGVAAMMTLAVLTSMSQLADAQATQAVHEAQAASVAVQQVVIVGKRLT